MSVIERLSGSNNRRDESLNIQLAEEIVKKGDLKGIDELVENLKNKDKAIQSDCIKVLYEIGERKPELIKDHYKEFLELTGNKNNRLVWGAITALDTIAYLVPALIYKDLHLILAASDKGSVITRDHAVNILIKLAGNSKYAETSLSLLLDELKRCPVNQLPMYAENSLDIIGPGNKKDFIKVLTDRIPEIEKESKRKRIEKVLKKLAK